MSNYFLTRKQQLTRLLHKYQSEVNSLPEGTLVIYQNGAKWYLQEKDKSGKTKRTYISKSKIDYASQLAKKALLKNYIRDIENEITAIKKCLQATYRAVSCATRFFYKISQIYKRAAASRIGKPQRSIV